jgi:hypothetical protein
VVDLNTSISATPFDALGGFYSNSGTPYSGAPSSNNFFDIDPTFAGEWNPDNWYLPAGQAFFQNSDQMITQTAEGVNVAGLDLLDYMMASDPPGMSGMGGTGF